MENKTTLITKGSFTFGPRLKFLMLTFALIVFYTTLLFSATIYIDPSYTGSTQNGAMSTPYKSWTSVTFSNGNSYLQKKGTTYNSSSQIFINSKTNVIIGAYGTGDKAKFSYTGSGYAFRVENSSYCTIQDFEVDGNINANSLVYVAGTSSNYSNNIKIQNCHLHNAHNTNTAGFGVLGWYNNNLKLLNTEIHNVAIDGLYLAYNINLEVGYCNIYDLNRRYFVNTNQSASSGDGIQLDGNYDGFHIHHTIIDRSNGAGNKHNLILNSLGSSNNATGILEYNTFITPGNVTSAVSIVRGNGIITRYNTFKGSTGALRLGADSKNNLVHNNLFYNCSYGVAVTYIYDGNASHPCTGTQVYNNVFYNTGRHISLDKTNVVSRNNIHYRTNSTDVAIYNYGGGSWTISHNCYSSAAAAGAPGTGSSPVIGDPKFVNPSTFDFHL
ncbi:MAG: hypothetical protein RBR28_14405, partial [Lentimicrobium sp.]|nr:hypothetical protein [Lentimicrobium sp.]